MSEMLQNNYHQRLGSCHDEDWSGGGADNVTYDGQWGPNDTMDITVMSHTTNDQTVAALHGTGWHQTMVAHADQAWTQNNDVAGVLEIYVLLHGTWVLYHLGLGTDPTPSPYDTLLGPLVTVASQTITKLVPAS